MASPFSDAPTTTRGPPGGCCRGAPDGGGSDVFVHVHEVEFAGMKTLVKGQLLTYNTAPARDGRLKAVNLRLLSR